MNPDSVSTTTDPFSTAKAALARRERTTPSVRHPEGLLRCQARCRRRHRQCPRAARDGFRVCWMHGAGSSKREREGRRKNPALGSLRHGFRARRETLDLMLRTEPNLAAEYAHGLCEAGVSSSDHERALVEALLRRFLGRADLHNPNTLDAALLGLARIMDLKRRS